jgi:2-amino-4-hydroxy-6-hydroxymethyldihydropteridine diphosphokinase
MASLTNRGVPTRLAAIGLGASLGERRQRLELAVKLLDLLPQVRVVACSRIYRTPPWGGVAKNPFLNAVVALSTSLEATALLAHCQHIERRLGRRPGLRWADRAVDLDLLWMEDLVVDSASFRLPHPRVAERSFVVVPLQEVLPGAVDPVSGRSFLEQHLSLGARAAWPRPAPVGILTRPRHRKADSRSTTAPQRIP